MKKKILIIIFSVLFAGCLTIPFPRLNAPKPPDTIYDYEDVMKTTPTAIVIGDKTYVLENKERTIRVAYQKKEKKLTFIQKIGNWFSSLSLIAFILVIAGLFLAPGTTIGLLLSLLKKWKNAAQQTIRAIKESNAVENNSELKNALSSKQSDETKKIVNNVKGSL